MRVQAQQTFPDIYVPGLLVPDVFFGDKNRRPFG